MKKLLLILLVGMALISFTKADTQELQMKFIVPDTNAPYFTYIPENASVPYGTEWEGVEFTAEDDNSFGAFSINDTEHFEIFIPTGMPTYIILTWTGQLDVGEYYVNVSINDSVGNVNWTIFNLNITDDEAPVFDNLRNLSGYTNQPFTKYITATDNVGVYCYYLNDTSVFNVDCVGKITNTEVLANETIYYLNISVNDTSNNWNSGEFYINITSESGGVTVYTCRYKSFGYYNTKLNWMVRDNCKIK